jgi:DNA-binding SARP family transcriptional activator
MTGRDGTRFRILGPIEAWADGRRVELGGPRQRTLLAFFLLHPNRALSSDVLIDAVWKSRPSATDNRLAMAIARLRKALGPLNGSGGTPLRTVSGGYLLTVGPSELDADQFNGRLSDGLHALNAGNAARAAVLLVEALTLWRGTPLAEVYYEDFAQPELRRLEEMRLVALETRIEAELQLGRHGQLVGELEAMLAQYPARERVACQLMLALYRSGRQTDALDVYQRTRIRLATELGLQPGPALTALQLQILHQISSLDLSGRPRQDIPAAPPRSHERRATFPAWAEIGSALARRDLNSPTSRSRPIPTRLTLTPEQISLKSRQLVAESKCRSAPFLHAEHLLMRDSNSDRGPGPTTDRHG